MTGLHHLDLFTLIHNISDGTGTERLGQLYCFVTTLLI
jgi:hypothetical protein